MLWLDFRKHSTLATAGGVECATKWRFSRQPLTGRSSQTSIMLLAVGLLLSTLVAQLDGRFLEVSKPPPGTVAIVPAEDDGDSVLNGPLFQDLQELDREKASELISVKLFNQYHARTFDVADRLDVGNRDLVEDGKFPVGQEDYDTVNRLDGIGNDLEISYAQPPPIVPAEVIELKENGIEQDLVLPEPMSDDARLLDEWSQTDSRPHRLPDGNKSSSLTTTTTTTTTRTTTVRKIRRRQQTVRSTGSHPLGSSTTTSTTRRSTKLATPYRPTTVRTSTSQRPARPKLDITRLNLDHLEDDLLLSYSTVAPPQALPLAGSAIPSARLLPRSIRQEEEVAAPPSCGCQHKKRSLANHLYSSEETIDPAGDYEDYDDYDYDELRLPRAPSRPLLLPALSGLLASPGSGENAESSVERAEKVHGTLERLMGIVTIFSHVDEFIQRKTKQSIRRLAKLYESEEQY